MTVVRTIALLAATVTTGLVAGVFVLYAHTIMPGLGATDDRTFVAAFQALDRAILNPWFMITGFGGALVTTLLAALANLRRAALRWIAAALLLYLVAVVVTVAVHLPLNDAIKAAGEPDRIADLAAVRQRFDEGRWAAWNLVRAVASTAAAVLLAWSLVVHGRSLPVAPPR